MKPAIFNLLLTLTITVSGFSQDKTDSIRISLVGVLVANIDSSINWYTHQLNFELLEKKEYPDYKLTIAFLKKGAVELELVENINALNRQEILKSKNATDITGIAKITFTVKNIRETYSQLQLKNVKFIIPLQQSNRKEDEFFFIITDNDNNWLQFIGKK